jgi:hypothetical protein
MSFAHLARVHGAAGFAWSNVADRSSVLRLSFHRMVIPALIVTLLLVVVIQPLLAQRTDCGTVNVTVREGMGMVQGSGGRRQL